MKSVLPLLFPRDGDGSRILPRGSVFFQGATVAFVPNSKVVAGAESSKPRRSARRPAASRGFRTVSPGHGLRCRKGLAELVFAGWKGAVADLTAIGFDRLGDGGAHVGELLDEARAEVGEQAEHIVSDKNLAVATCAGADADRGDFQLARDAGGDFGRHALQDHREGAGLLG